MWRLDPQKAIGGEGNISIVEDIVLVREIRRKVPRKRWAYWTDLQGNNGGEASAYFILPNSRLIGREM